MTNLSVNVNKIATLRNARGKDVPNLLKMVDIIVQSGAQGITVHPRPDARHIRYQDVSDIKEFLKNHSDTEFNIEGYPSDSFLELIKKTKPHQCTLVPDPPEVLTSNAGWDFEKNQDLLIKVCENFKKLNIRVSLFLDPFTMNENQWQALKNIGPHCIELYTEKYAESFKDMNVINSYKEASEKAKTMGININAGHDLNQNNLGEFLKQVPNIEEVSIGQALIAEALEEGLETTIKKYLKIIAEAHQ